MEFNNFLGNSVESKQATDIFEFHLATLAAGEGDILRNDKDIIHNTPSNENRDGS